MEKKFGLISSMMKRLGISPRLFISQCIEENRLSLDCSVTDGTSVIKFKSSNRDKCRHDNEDDDKKETLEEKLDVKVTRSVEKSHKTAEDCIAANLQVSPK